MTPTILAAFFYHSRGHRYLVANLNLEYFEHDQRYLREDTLRLTLINARDH